jgi:hypothetical protein
VAPGKGLAMSPRVTRGVAQNGLGKVPDGHGPEASRGQTEPVQEFVGQLNHLITMVAVDLLGPGHREAGGGRREAAAPLANDGK